MHHPGYRQGGLFPALSTHHGSPRKLQKSSREALALFEEYLKAQQWQEAYDVLLAAMRVAPEDEKVFLASLRFVRAAGVDEHGEGLPLAQDVHQRAASLLPFRPVKQLKDARKAHTEAGDAVFPRRPAAEEEDPLAEIERLLRAVRRDNLPGYARTQLLHEAEAELASQARRAATGRVGEREPPDFWKRWEELKSRHNEAQKAVLAALYREGCHPRVKTWEAKAANVLKSLEKDGEDVDLIEFGKKIKDLLDEGQALSRDLAPYVEADLKDTLLQETATMMTTTLTRLSRQRDWNYNRWALDRIDTVAKNEAPHTEKLASYAELEESRLSPFVAQRLAEAWKTSFEKVSKEEQVAATKQRILKDYLP